MNRVTLAVAGSRKTQSVVDACVGGDSAKRRLALTYTLTGQTELDRRLQRQCPAENVPEVMGWYAFLMRHWIRPFIPLLYPGRRLRGLNFEGEPVRGMYAKGASRFLDAKDHAFKLHLSKLAVDVASKSGGAVIDRLSRIYDEIYVDEIQDLTGSDLHILDALMDSPIHLEMVGDIRQSVFDTNPRDPTLKQFRGVKMLDWFSAKEAAGKLTIRQAATTWRSNQQIADFSDRIFPKSIFCFEATTSAQTARTDHDGVFAVPAEHSERYVETFNPLCLRDSIRTARHVQLPFMNFGKVKGLTVDRVLIYPTGPIEAFLATGKELAPKSACGLYVGVTRARHSVAFVVKDPGRTKLPVWKSE